jgi:hypothetical protein
LKFGNRFAQVGIFFLQVAGGFSVLFEEFVEVFPGDWGVVVLVVASSGSGCAWGQHHLFLVTFRFFFRVGIAFRGGVLFCIITELLGDGFGCLGLHVLVLGCKKALAYVFLPGFLGFQFGQNGVGSSTAPFEACGLSNMGCVVPSNGVRRWNYFHVHVHGLGGVSHFP